LADATQDVDSREGVATFRRFDNHALGLDRQLQKFANSVRPLGSSVGLMNATYHLRGALIQIEALFRENVSYQLIVACFTFLSLVLQGRGSVCGDSTRECGTCTSVSIISFILVVILSVGH
jgi:hypothetical protein